MGSRPKAPKATAQETAMIARQGIELDDQIAVNEKRLKAIARGKLGSKSLLGTAADAAKKEVGDKSYSANGTMLPISGESGLFGGLSSKGIKKQNAKIGYSGGR